MPQAVAIRVDTNKKKRHVAAEASYMAREETATFIARW